MTQANRLDERGAAKEAGRRYDELNRHERRKADKLARAQSPRREP